MALVTAVVQVQSPTQKILHATSVAGKKEKERKGERKKGREREEGRERGRRGEGGRERKREEERKELLGPGVS